jgi:hypothetical protein
MGTESALAGAAMGVDRDHGATEVLLFAINPLSVQVGRPERVDRRSPMLFTIAGAVALSALFFRACRYGADSRYLLQALP